MLMNEEARTVSVLQYIFSFLEDHRCPIRSCSSHREDVLGIRGDVQRLLQCGTAAAHPAVDQTHLGVSSALRDPRAACAIGQLHAVSLGLESVIEALELCQVSDDMRCRTGVHHQALSGDTASWLTGHKLEREGAVIRLLVHSASVVLLPLSPSSSPCGILALAVPLLTTLTVSYLVTSLATTETHNVPALGSARTCT